MQEATRAARGDNMWDILYADDLVITAETEDEAVRKFSTVEPRVTTLPNNDGFIVRAKFGRKICP